jgi:hypothetical protein
MPSPTRTGTVLTPGHDHGPTLVATEVVLLWPRGLAESTTVADAGLWPVFVMVVGERPDAEQTLATPLFDLLDRPRHSNEMAVVAGGCSWSILDARNALLKFRVRATAPVRFTAQIIVPAQRVLGLLDVVARGATIGITTRRRARLLDRQVGVSEALREVVLLGCAPSSELATLAELVAATPDSDTLINNTSPKASTSAIDLPRPTSTPHPWR